MQAPQWLTKAERRFGHLAIPRLAIVLVGTQVFGLIVQVMNPPALHRMVLYPELVFSGNLWDVFRLITFICIPTTDSFFFLLIFLYFMYFIVDALEQNWGGFKTTLYVVTAWLLTIAFSFIFQWPVHGILDIETSLLLAAAVLFPEFEILLFFVLPVKLRWMGWLIAGYIAFRFLVGGHIDKFYLAMVYGNYLLFFGPYHIDQFRQMQRRKKFKDQWK